MSCHQEDISFDPSSLFKLEGMSSYPYSRARNLREAESAPIIGPLTICAKFRDQFPPLSLLLFAALCLTRNASEGHRSVNVLARPVNCPSDPRVCPHGGEGASAPLVAT